MKNIIYQYKCPRCHTNHIMDKPLEIKIDENRMSENQKNFDNFQKVTKEEYRDDNEISKVEKKYDQIIENHNNKQKSKWFKNKYRLSKFVDNCNIHIRGLTIFDSKNKVIEHTTFVYRGIDYYHDKRMYSLVETDYIECPSCESRTYIGITENEIL